MTSIGINVGRDVISQGITTDAAEQFLRFNSAMIRDEWSWLDIFPNSRPEHDDAVLSDNTVWGWSNEAFLENDALRIRFVTKDRDAPFSPLDSEHKTGFFLVEQESTKYERFRVSMRAWKNIETQSSGSQEAVLYVEASYPADKPYQTRQKQVFSLEIFKPVEIALSNSLPTP